MCDEGTRKYSWSDTGQVSYRLWWDGVVKEAWVDFEAGLECIERAWKMPHGLVGTMGQDLSFGDGLQITWRSCETAFRFT
jgi:hypothetical protein